MGWKRLVGPTLVALLVGCISGCTPPAGGDGAGTARPETILLVTIDDFDASEWQPLGGTHPAPNLERLLDGATVLRDGWSAAPMTRPAVASILTGLAPDRHGVRDNVFVSLPDDVATLPERLHEAGYRTAAFPDSNFLDFGSGLLRGFDTVADPPKIEIAPGRWISRSRTIQQVADDVAAWIEAGTEGPSFLWVHLSRLRRVRLEAHERMFVLEHRKDEQKAATAEETDEAKRQDRVETIIGRIDDALGRIVDALDGRAGAAPATLLVVGTSGSSTVEDELPGEGFSLAPETLRSPLILRLAPGAGGVDEGRTAWTPDVAATVAALAGVELDPRSEGVDLRTDPPADRTLFSFSWAPLDQGGWLALRGARQGGTAIRRGLVEESAGLDGAGADPGVVSSLEGALSRRIDPARAAVPRALIDPILAAKGIRPDPIPEAGRAFGDPGSRFELMRHWLQSGYLTQGRRVRRALSHYESILEIDPSFYGMRVDYGMVLALSDETRGPTFLKRAVELYPDDPEILHWYAHAVWATDRETSGRILELILPFKATDGDVLYDLACLRSLQGNLDESASFLERAMKHGFDDVQHMERDPDLRALRESGRFAEIVRGQGQ